MNIHFGKKHGKFHQHSKYSKKKCEYESDEEDDTNNNDYENTIYTMGNKVFFYDEINAETILELKKQIHNLELELFEVKTKYSLEPTIELHLYSNGGDVFMGLDMYRCIKNSKLNIDTYVDGMIASAATFLFLAGRHRYISEYGHILIHQLSTGFWGKYEDLKDEYTNSKALMENIKSLYQNNTKMPKTKLNEILKRELYLSSNDSIKYNIATSIY